jgi:hypothetical protein
MRRVSQCVSLFVFVALIGPDALRAAPADELRADVRDALQDSMRVSKDNREMVVHRLINLYGQLATAGAADNADRMRMQSQVRARLTRLSAIITRQMEIDAVAAGQAVPDKAFAANARLPDNQVLAQQFVPLGRPRAGGFGRPPAIGLGANRAAAAAQPPDNGQALVDLIQRTIAPASWDVNGGPGSIVYFRPSRVLVVRQRSEVHEQLQGVVRALRQ